MDVRTTDRLTRRGLAGVAALVLTLAVAACGGSSGPAASAPSSGSGAGASQSSAGGPPATLDVRVVKGLPDGGVQAVTVDRGQTVQLTGTSDTPESLHVHGYDKTLELQPGRTASLSFVADVSGSFEIETHESGKLVAQLNVS